MYQELITKILGDHTEREGEVANLVLEYVYAHPSELYGEREAKTLMGEIDTYLTENFGKGLDFFLGSCRRRDMVEVRAMICLYLYEEEKATLAAIAKILGRHHCTIYHSIQCAKGWILFDRLFKEKYESFKNYLIGRR